MIEWANQPRYWACFLKEKSGFIKWCLKMEGLLNAVPSIFGVIGAVKKVAN